MANGSVIDPQQQPISGRVWLAQRFRAWVLLAGLAT